MYKWNPIFNLIIKIKDDYNEKFKDNDLKFEKWLEKLKNPEYNNFFDCLQVEQSDEFILIRYGIAEMQKSMWTDKNSPYRECRSVVVDLKKEELVVCGFRKFFNLNEVEENMLDGVIESIKEAKVFEVTDKLDGSMQNARWYNDGIFFSGSMSLDENESWRLKNGKSLLVEDYQTMLKDNSNLTFTFEYVSDKNPHVVAYTGEQEGLYLIGARNILTGYQLSYEEVRRIAKQYKQVKVVAMEDKPLDELLDLMKSLPSNKKEGWVLNIDGHLVKIKCDDYVSVHRILDRVSSVNVVIEAIANESYDDLISKVPQFYRNRVESISERVFEYTYTLNKLINKYYRQAPKKDKKEFMIWVSNNAPKQIQSYLRCKYLKQDYNLLKVGKNGYKKMSMLGLEWVE